MKTLINRMKKPTPCFFKKIRNTGIAVAGVGTALLTAPVVLPVLLLNIAGYLTVTGTVMTAVSQAAVKHERK